MVNEEFLWIITRNGKNEWERNQGRADGPLLFLVNFINVINQVNSLGVILWILSSICAVLSVWELYQVIFSIRVNTT